MKKVIRTILIFLLCIVSFWLGKKYGWRLDCPGSLGEEPDLIVELQEGRSYHTNFKDYIRTADRNSLAKLFEYPIDIDNAKCDFLTIFNQKRYAGLRVFPGIKDKSKNELTLVFIGTDENGRELIEPLPVPGDRVDPLTQEAKVQDNNRPCNPCTSDF